MYIKMEKKNKIMKRGFLGSIKTSNVKAKTAEKLKSMEERWMKKVMECQEANITM